MTQDNFHYIRMAKLKAVLNWSKIVNIWFVESISSVLKQVEKKFCIVFVIVLDQVVKYIFPIFVLYAEIKQLRFFCCFTAQKSSDCITAVPGCAVQQRSVSVPSCCASPPAGLALFIWIRARPLR